MLSRLRLPGKTITVSLHQVPIFCWVVMMHSPLKPPKENCGVTSPSAHILLVYDSLKCQHSNRTHRSGQKLPPPGNSIFVFKWMGNLPHVDFKYFCWWQFSVAWNFQKNRYSVNAPGDQILLGCDNAQSFETPIMYNHSVTVPSAQVSLRYDYLQSFENLPQKITVSLHQVPIN